MFITGEIREVTPNVAHDLIDSGKAKLLSRNPRNRTPQRSPYGNRKMQSKLRSPRHLRSNQS